MFDAFNTTFFNLYEAYAPGIVAQLKDKFKAENAHLTDEVIEWYLNRFQQLKDSPLIRNYAKRIFDIEHPTDVFNYTWEQLEGTVDQAASPADRPKAGNAAASAEAKLIYNQNGLRIYDAPSAEACIQLGHEEFGRSYTFCIARQNGSMYSSYRLGGKSFYFVYDENKPTSDNTHLLVIQASGKKNEYIATKADNKGDSTNTWEQILKLQPKLQGLQHLFKFHPFTAEESVNSKGPSGFDRLPYEHKRLYISSKRPIYMSSWDLLPRELKALYSEIAAGRLPSTFFYNEAPLPDLNNAKGLQDYMKERDPVRLLQKTLPQNAARYAERMKQFLKSAHFFVHKNKQGDYVVDSYNIYGGDTLELKFLKIFNREDVRHIYNSFDLVEVPQGNIVKKEIGIGDTMTISTDDNEQFEQVKDAFVSFDADKITQFIPGFWNKIHVQNEYNAEGRFFKYLFSKCMLQQEPVNKEVSNFISKYDYFFHFLNFTGGVNKSQKQIISRLSDSVLFYNAVERYNLDEQKPGYVGKVDVASKKNLRCAFIFDETERKVWAFVFKQENQSLVFLNAYKRSNVRQNKREVYKAVKTMPGMPVYLISTDASGKELISFDEGMQQIKDEQNQKKLAKKQQMAATTSVVDKFKQLKKLNTQDRRTYMQQHGTMMPIKVGRKTIVGNNPVLVAPFGDAVALLATATKNNMESIATAFNITWEKIIIEPVAQRPAFSFFIKGKKRNGTVVYYCRKEFNAAGAGQSYVINATTGNSHIVSHLMSIIAKQETHQINI
jgi:hypothetical protein